MRTRSQSRKSPTVRPTADQERRLVRSIVREVLQIQRGEGVTSIQLRRDPSAYLRKLSVLTNTALRQCKTLRERLRYQAVYPYAVFRMEGDRVAWGVEMLLKREYDPELEEEFQRAREEVQRYADEICANVTLDQPYRLKLPRRSGVKYLSDEIRYRTIVSWRYCPHYQPHTSLMAEACVDEAGESCLVTTMKKGFY